MDLEVSSAKWPPIWCVKNMHDSGVYHYTDVIIERDGVSNHQRRLFVQPFVKAQIKENVKALPHWLLWGEFTSSHKGPITRKMFPIEDVIVIWHDVHVVCVEIPWDEERSLLDKITYFLFLVISV